MAKRLIWDNTFALPKRLEEDEELAWALRETLVGQMEEDQPDHKDILRAIYDYNTGSKEVREGMNAMAVWLTGWQFPRLVAMVVTGAGPNDKEVDSLLDRWKSRKGWDPRDARRK